MAHQAHNIPWTVLASTLKLKRTNTCQHDAENFHLKREADRGKRLTYFVNAFARNVLDHARCERDKYPEAYVIPSPEETVISDEVAKKILPTVHRWRLDHNWDYELGSVQQPYSRELCRHGSVEACECPLPRRERRMAAFLRRYRHNECYWFYQRNGEAFFNLEVFKTLLLYGEMDILLRVCSCPNIDLKRWWEVAQCNCEARDVGWESICRVAMESYLMLNLLHCFPETWDNDGSPIEKYTGIKVYQQVVRRCTLSGETSEVHTYPHRQFFGIEQGRFSICGGIRDQARWGFLLGRGRDPHARYLSYYPYGLMPYSEFVAFEKPVTYQPESSDVSNVRWILCQKGLPVELSNVILQKAAYTPQRRLPVPGHPFHPDNRDELDKYLKYCWTLVVRCTTLGQALGMDMEYILDDMLKTSLNNMLGCKCFKMCNWSWGDDNRQHYTFT